MRNLLFPGAWRGLRRRFRVIFFVYGPLTVLALAVTIFMFSYGTPLKFITLGGSLAAAGVTVQAYLNSNIDLRDHLPKTAERDGSPRIWMSSHRGDVVCQHLIHLGGMVVGLGGFYAVASGGTSEAEGREARGAIMLLVLGLPVAVWAGARLFSRVVRREEPLGLGVSPAGIHHTSWWGEVTYRWENIKDVVPVGSPKRSVRPYFYLVQIVLNDRGKNWARDIREAGQKPSQWGFAKRKSAFIPVSRLDTYPTLVPHLLRFYFEHPELRKELGTEESLARIRAANFTPSG